MLAATPLGNPGDASPRLVDALATADVVAAEDTRRTRRLAADLGVTMSGRVVSFYDAVERERSRELVDLAHAGRTILVVSDAGMPTVSDPGFRLVALAVEEGVAVTVLPGPSAVLAALAMSGLPVDRFCFEGFLPRKGGERSTRIAELADEPRTMVFFEAPHRLAAMLEALASGLGPDRRAAVCRELTKTYEEARRGTLGELAAVGARRRPRRDHRGGLRGQRRAAAGVERTRLRGGLGRGRPGPRGGRNATQGGDRGRRAEGGRAQAGGVRRGREGIRARSVGSAHG